jgi:hypothetical protein
LDLGRCCRVVIAAGVLRYLAEPSRRGEALTRGQVGGGDRHLTLDWTVFQLREPDQV